MIGGSCNQWSMLDMQTPSVYQNKLICIVGNTTYRFVTLTKEIKILLDGVKIRQSFYPIKELDGLSKEEIQKMAIDKKQNKDEDIFDLLEGKTDKQE